MADDKTRDTKQDEDQEPVYFIDGVRWTLTELIADLEFGEKRELRELVRESTGNADGEWYQAGDDADILPGIVFILRRRNDPEYTMADALKVKPKDLEPPPEKDEKPKTAVPPTPAAAHRGNGSDSSAPSETTGTPASSSRPASVPGT